MSQVPDDPFADAPGARDVSAEGPDLAALSQLAPELAHTFVSVSSDIALVIDAAGVIRTVAQGAEPVSGQAAGWVGRRWADTVTGDTQDKVQQLLEEVRSAGVTRRREVSHAVDGGSGVPVAYAAIRLGRNGPVLAVGRNLRAVSAIQQRFVEAQQELERDYWRQRDFEARHRMLFQVAHDAVMTVDAATLTVVDANRAAADLFIVSPPGLVGRPLTEGLSPAARPGVQELLVMARATGRPAEMRALAGTPPGHAAPLLVDLSATPIRADDRMLLLVRARLIDATLQGIGGQGRMAELVDEMTQAVAVTDSGGRVRMANPAFAALARLGHAAAAVGRPLQQLLPSAPGDIAGILHFVLANGLADGQRAGALQVSASLLAEDDQSYIGWTLSPEERHWTDVPAPLGELAQAIDRLGAQLGLLPLPELVKEAADLAERCLLAGALQRCDGDALRTAQWLRIPAEHLWQRLRHHGLEASATSDDLSDGDSRRRPPPLLN